MGDGKDELRARFRDSVNEDDTDTPGNTGGPDNSGDSDNSGNTGGSGDLGDTGDSGNSDSDSAAGETEDANNTSNQSNPGNSGRMGHTQNPSTTEMEDDGEVDDESGEVGNPGNSGDAGNTSGADSSRHTSVPGPDPDPQSLRSERSQYPLYLTEEFQTHINKQYTLEKAERMEDVDLEKHKHFLEAVVRAGLDHDDLEEYIDAQLERY